MSRNVLRLVWWLMGPTRLKRKNRTRSLHFSINQRWRWIRSLGEVLPAQKRANYVRIDSASPAGLETVKFQTPCFRREDSLDSCRTSTKRHSICLFQQQPSKRIFSRQADPSQSKQSKKSIHSINSSLTLLQNHDEY